MSLLALLLLAGCPSPENPARKAVDAAEPATPPPPLPTGAGGPAAATGESWSCPMHPEVVQDHAGVCPTCKMDLVKKGG